MRLLDWLRAITPCVTSSPSESVVHATSLLAMVRDQATMEARRLKSASDEHRAWMREARREITTRTAEEEARRPTPPTSEVHARIDAIARQVSADMRSRE